MEVPLVSVVLLVAALAHGSAVQEPPGGRVQRFLLDSDVCVDHSPETCARYIDHDICTSPDPGFRKWVLENCRKHCGLCADQVTTTNTCGNGDVSLCLQIGLAVCTHPAYVQLARSSCRQFCGLCPVDGGWGNWQTWGACSQTCGFGTKARRRSCDNPSPANGGHACAGNAWDSVSCMVKHCPVDGGWGNWQSWGACSQTCGFGTKARRRSCDNPSPANRDQHCAGNAWDSVSCLVEHCPVDGGWGNWQSWGTCSHTCGFGIQVRQRQCNSPSPAYSGQPCAGIAKDTVSCLVEHCPLTGGWGDWQSWSTCSVTCGGGRRTRVRSCDNPSPAVGGQYCHGPVTDTTSCHIAHCPVDGGWGNWQAWDPCSHTCGDGGIRTRVRSCDLPSPAYGGQGCHGNTTETAMCHAVDCPVWTPWLVSSCSVSCGTGSRQGMRRCSTGSDKDCPGSAFKTETCVESPCPVNGSWGSWAAYGTCSVTCCNGHMTRTRQCDHPAPSHGGESCTGDSTQNRGCANPCKGDAVWSSWGQWSSCSVTCTLGTRTRTRTCANKTVCTGDCVGSFKQMATCDLGPCPVWTPWLLSSCSVTCGTGSRQGMRRCSTGTDKDCPGSAFKTETCVEDPCLVAGGWDAWQSWGACSRTCGDGVHTRQRSCNQPTHGDNSCHGNATETAMCHAMDCPHWGAFHEIGSCSVTCGVGSIVLQRNCSTGNSNDCNGSPYMAKICTGPAC